MTVKSRRKYMFFPFQHLSPFRRLPPKPDCSKAIVVGRFNRWSRLVTASEATPKLPAKFARCTYVCWLATSTPHPRSVPLLYRVLTQVSVSREDLRIRLVKLDDGWINHCPPPSYGSIHLIGSPATWNSKTCTPQWLPSERCAGKLGGT